MKNQRSRSGGENLSARITNNVLDKAEDRGHGHLSEGAAVGAGLGALLGSFKGVGGAIAGAAIGAAIGGLIGESQDD